jgi:tetratricopeptide (TPR) repeat protein
LTQSSRAQTWFDRGLVWCYGFHHEEAVACFETALAEDPNCAMAHWGIAYALGPNYNKPWEAFQGADLTDAVSRAHRALLEAQATATPSSVEAALIGAVSQRFPAELPAEAPPADWSVWNVGYADAMREVYRQFPDDPDVAALTADALMNLTPWQLWDQRTGAPAAGAATEEARLILDRALAAPGGTDHPGLLHFYIHLMEMSPHPERALWVGEALRDLVPDAGHLRHMPTHLDVLVGDYQSVIRGNAAAIRADEKVAAKTGETSFYTLYRAHNYHFLVYGAMFAGRSAQAFDACDWLLAAIPDDLLRVCAPPMADWLEPFLAVKFHAQIRFGRWQDIIDTSLPVDQQLYCVTIAFGHYARGVAYAATGQVAAAEAERDAFREATARVPVSRTLFNNTAVDILAVAAEMLDGEICYRRGEFETAFAHLRRAIELDDGLPYDEPWGWMQPTRHAYGALLLEQGRVAEAEAVYRADLGLDDTLPRACQHPGNVWSLHGYHECLVRLGKHETAAIVAQQLALAAADADVPITASCFCRLSPAPSTGLDNADGNGAVGPSVGDLDAASACGCGPDGTCACGPGCGCGGTGPNSQA